MSLDLLKRKVMGIMDSIGKMNPTEKKGLPTRLFGEDYNKLHELVLKEKPDLADYLPPKVEIIDTGYQTFTKQSFGEVHSFCSQIYQML